MNNNYLIVSYNITGSKAKRVAFEDKINTYGTWAMLNKNTYILVTTQGAEKVRNFLMQEMDHGDEIFVGALSGQMAWSLDEEISEWIRKNIK